jgi:hypothetical protein
MSVIVPVHLIFLTLCTRQPYKGPRHRAFLGPIGATCFQLRTSHDEDICLANAANVQDMTEQAFGRSVSTTRQSKAKSAFFLSYWLGQHAIRNSIVKAAKRVVKDRPPVSAHLAVTRDTDAECPDVMLGTIPGRFVAVPLRNASAPGFCKCGHATRAVVICSQASQHVLSSVISR